MLFGGVDRSCSMSGDLGDRTILWLGCVRSSSELIVRIRMTMGSGVCVASIEAARDV